MAKPNYTQIGFFLFVSVAIITGIILLAVKNAKDTKQNSSNFDSPTTTLSPEAIPSTGVSGTGIGPATPSTGDQFSQCAEGMFKIQPMSEFQSTFSYSVDPFYKKFINVGGLAITSSEIPTDQALIQAATWTCNMVNLAKPQVVQGLIQAKSKITVIGTQEQITEVPEYRLQDVQINQLRAFGGSIENPTTIAAEENLLCTANDPFISECKLLHQFGGHAMSMLSGNQTFLTGLKRTYFNAMNKGLWANTYAAENEQEYFAEGVESWFSCNKMSSTPDGLHNGVNTREKLKEYDSGLSRLLTEFYGDMPIRYNCPKPLI